MISLFVVLFVMIIVALIVVFSSLTIIPQGNVGVVESFGKYNRTLEPGMHFIVPILYNVKHTVSLKQTPLEIKPQSVITKDNVIVKIDEAIKYHVTNVKAYIYDNEDSVTSMIQDCQSNLRGIIGKMDLNDVLNGTEEINQSLFASVKDITDGYGLAIDRINIGEINVSDEIIESMNKLITASRDKESSITIAEGRKQSVILESEARSKEMEIDAEARAKQTQIDAEARAKRIEIDTKADAEQIRVITEAEKNRIETLNAAANSVKLTDASLTYLGIEAFKEVVKSDSNTIVLPSNMAELGTIAAAKHIFNDTK